LGRVAPRTRVSYFSILTRFCRAVSVSPDELVAKQKAADGDDRFALLDRLQDYVNGLDVTRNYKVFTYNAVRSFFLHNRAELPRERFNIQNSKPPSTPHLTVEHVRRIVYAATVRDRSMILCAFAGFMGKGELEYVNLHSWPQIRDQWRSSLIRIDLPGRKTNHRPYYTFIGGDALQALREYIGDDLKRKAIWTTKYNVPISRKAFYKAFFRLSQRVGYVSRKRGDLGVRYGFNPHEMRDIARSLWHQSGSDRDVAEFLMGHNVDPLRYDKIYTLDPEWVQSEYLKALPYLNLLSSERDVKKQQDTIKLLEERIAEMEKTLAEIRNS